MSPSRTDPREEPTQAPHARGPDRNRLLIYWEGGSMIFDLPSTGTVTLGRSSGCEICIDHPSVSRKHVAVHAGPIVEVEDLGSSNGTRLNGKKIDPHRRIALSPGVLVEAGLGAIILQGREEFATTNSVSPTRAKPEAENESTMNRLYRLSDMVAESRISVILTGETGSGKEVMAQRIHARSPRANKPFIPLHCAAMPEGLLESELFGFERGAFTGAVQAKAGLLEVADGGTLFLDEVTEMPLLTQAKLLRVIETREVTRLGALKPRSVDLRFICATNRDIQEQIAAGAFREDLYYRLNGIAITVPPLRNRQSEIEPIARQFAATASAASGRPTPALAPDAVQRLTHYTWPGNIRELKNVIERAVVFCQGSTIRAQHILLPTAHAAPQDPRTGVPTAAGTDLRSDVEALERRRILDALDQCAGNQTKAAKLLGISRRMLLTRLDAFQLPRPRKS